MPNTSIATSLALIVFQYDACSLYCQPAVFQNVTPLESWSGLFYQRFWNPGPKL